MVRAGKVGSPVRQAFLVPEDLPESVRAELDAQKIRTGDYIVVHQHGEATEYTLWRDLRPVEIPDVQTLLQHFVRVPMTGPDGLPWFLGAE